VANARFGFLKIETQESIALGYLLLTVMVSLKKCSALLLSPFAFWSAR
jgi:tryptophan-rich sensory protein